MSSEARAKSVRTIMENFLLYPSEANILSMKRAMTAYQSACLEEYMNDKIAREAESAQELKGQKVQTS